MDIVFSRVAGLDVHKKFITACLLTNDITGRVHTQVRTFGTMTADIATLRTWLKESTCTEVAMESTGVFWPPWSGAVCARSAGSWSRHSPGGYANSTASC